MLAHTLIAGDTGSGKSWTENKIVRRLIEEKADLILIDPKKLELEEYKPHAIIYADDNSSISMAIRAAYSKMQARIMETKEKGLKEYTGNPLYIVIDEMLPITMNKDFKKDGTLYYIEQIAILGRAARVFLIICTQKATRKSIPDMVKTCFYNRICLRQFDKRDYRYVLDESVDPLVTLYGECYIRTAGQDAIKIKSDDVVSLLFDKKEEG
jgi:DNA segregation ATPase FtsK/SpoIIIE-like protein